MKKIVNLIKSILFFCLSFGISSIAYGQCTATSPNVEITIESIEILAGCDGDPTLDTTLEPTISINGSVLEFGPSNSADGDVLGADPNPGTYTVGDGDLSGGCASSATLGIGAAGGSTNVPVNVQIWEEDGCGGCSYGTGSTCNDDADFANLGTVNVDITQPTGSFASGCYIFNYSVDCPPPCDPINCTNDVSIEFTSVDANGCDGDPLTAPDLEAAIQINGTVYEFTVNDGGNTLVSTANENCAGDNMISFGTVAAGTSSVNLGTVQVWEEDGCGACSFGTGSTCNDDADFGSTTHTIDLNQIGGSISAGCFSFNYTTTCTSVCCLSAGAIAGAPFCAGDNALFNVSFNESDTPTTYEVFDQTNGVVIGSGTSSPVLATVTGPTTAGPIMVVVRDQNDPNGCVTPPLTVNLIDCPEIIPGCTDPCSAEYSPLATVDDGSCMTAILPVPCDDGDDCTIDDMVTVGLDGNFCVPCAGTPQDCATAGATTTVACDDGNPCTINDMETTLDCDGSVCEVCAGTVVTPPQPSITCPPPTIDFCDGSFDCMFMDTNPLTALNGITDDAIIGGSAAFAVDNAGVLDVSLLQIGATYTLTLNYEENGCLGTEASCTFSIVNGCGAAGGRF